MKQYMKQIIILIITIILAIFVFINNTECACVAAECMDCLFRTEDLIYIILIIPIVLLNVSQMWYGIEKIKNKNNIVLNVILIVFSITISLLAYLIQSY